MHATNTIAISAVALLGTLFLGGAPQDQAQPAPKPTFVLDAGEHELAKVIESSGKFLYRSYLLAPTELGGQNPKVTLPQQLELDAAGCEAVVSQLAYTHNLIATPLDRSRGLWEFVNVNGAKRCELGARAVAATPDEVRRLRSVRIYVSTQITVEHVRATVAMQTLRPFFASAGPSSLSLGTAGNERVILLQGMSESVAQALDAIAGIDQPQPLPKIEDDRLMSIEKRVLALEEAMKLAGDKDK